MRTYTWIFLFILFLTSCGTTQRRAYVPKGPMTTLRVENQNWLDMTIYVLYGTQQVRIGKVTGLTTKVLVIPEYLIKGTSSLRFIAAPIGGQRAPVSQEITVSPGEEVEMIISN